MPKRCVRGTECWRWQEQPTQWTTGQKKARWHGVEERRPTWRRRRGEIRRAGSRDPVLAASRLSLLARIAFASPASGAGAAKKHERALQRRSTAAAGARIRQDLCHQRLLALSFSSSRLFAPTSLPICCPFLRKNIGVARMSHDELKSWRSITNRIRLWLQVEDKSASQVLTVNFLKYSSMTHAQHTSYHLGISLLDQFFITNSEILLQWIYTIALVNKADVA